MWIWFQGPFQNQGEPAPALRPKSDPEKAIIWRIAPAGGRFIKMDEVQPITYGVVPPGWEQQIPAVGMQPEALMDGYVYYIGVVPGHGGGSETCIFIKNGKVQSYRDQDERSGCGKKQ